MYAFISIGLAAALGAWMRWGLGMMLNSTFPTIPMGTLAANLLGGFLMGIFMALTRNHLFIPEVARLAIVTGFLGGLTTFSTFSAETAVLLTHHQYMWSTVIVIGHVLGSILALFMGLYTVKLLTA